MQYLKFSNISNNVSGNVHLPASKSESNRALIIRELSGFNFNINNLSDAEDTVILSGILDKINNRKNFEAIETINAGAAGTVMRFLTAFLCIKKGKWMLTGNDRMLQRPIKELVDALNQIGAGIIYINNDGFPPILIEGEKINKSVLYIDPRVSSQFISAILMIAPILADGLKIYFKEKDRIVSRPYIEMTLKIMAHFGITYHFEKNYIYVEHQPYKQKDININFDWSAASYFYEVVALSDYGAQLFLKGLKKDGLQGDEIVSEIFKKIGVSTIIENGGIRIIKDSEPTNDFSFDFMNCPDIAQTVIVCCGVLGIRGLFYGLESLAIKETDRINALKNELSNLGCNVNILNNGTLELTAKITKIPAQYAIKTYNDHRMAMAFAPLALKFSNIMIENPNVVRKSYPLFWENISNIGLEYIISD